MLSYLWKFNHIYNKYVKGYGLIPNYFKKKNNYRIENFDP